MWWKSAQHLESLAFICLIYQSILKGLYKNELHKSEEMYGSWSEN